MARRRAVAVPAPSRLPIAFIFRVIRGLLILVFVLFLFLGVAAAILTYRVITAHNDTETVSPTSYFSNYVFLNFNDWAGGEHEGWLLLGLRGAPAIILCHGYGSNRSDLLSLGTILRENHYNVYLFNFSGPKAKEGYSNLGVRQADDLMQAIETVTKQVEVNPHRVGLFGTNLGGYAALVAAMQSPKVKTLAVDTIYAAPERMFELQIDQALGGSSPLFRYIANAEFHLFTWGTKPYPIRDNLSKLQGMPKLFISGRDLPVLAEATEDLYKAAPQPKQLRVLDHSQASLASSAEKKEYENQVLNFFLQNLSLRAD
jgi:esterase/lipase